MKFVSVINNILMHNPVEQIINIKLIMVMESKYIKNAHQKYYSYIFIYFNSLDNKEISVFCLQKCRSYDHLSMVMFFFTYVYPWGNDFFYLRPPLRCYVTTAVVEG